MSPVRRTPCWHPQGERVAQTVEHVTFNHGVLGSIPSALTSKIKQLWQFFGAVTGSENRGRATMWTSRDRWIVAASTDSILREGRDARALVVSLWQDPQGVAACDTSTLGTSSTHGNQITREHVRPFHTGLG